MRWKNAMLLSFRASPEFCDDGRQHQTERDDGDRRGGKAPFRRIAVVGVTGEDASAIDPVVVRILHVLTRVEHVARAAETRRADNSCNKQYIYSSSSLQISKTL